MRVGRLAWKAWKFLVPAGDSIPIGTPKNAWSPGFNLLYFPGHVTLDFGRLGFRATPPVRDGSFGMVRELE